MRVVDVVAGAVGEHRVDEMGLDLGRLRALAGEPAGVAAGRLVLEVPADLVVLDVAVDQHRRREHGVGVGGAAERDPVLRLDPAHLRDGHGVSLVPARSTPKASTVPGEDRYDPPVPGVRTMVECSTTRRG